MKKGKRGRPKGSTNKTTIKKPKIVKVKPGDIVIFEWMGEHEKGEVIKEDVLYDGTPVMLVENGIGYTYPIRKEKIVEKL